MIRVVLADDHPVVRIGIRGLLEAGGDIQVIGEAADGRRAMQLILDPALVIDVLVLDLSLPRLSGMEVLSQALAARPSLGVLILSMHPEEQYARRLLAAGACGYLAKDRSEHDVVDAVRKIASGGRFVSAQVAQRLEGAPAAPAALHDSLTAREMQVFLMIVSGQSVTDIAVELDLTLSTVNTHLGRVRAKLGVSSLAGVVSYAHQVGLIG